jgi:hypothetical protein
MKLRPFSELVNYIAGLGYGFTLAAILLEHAHNKAMVQARAHAYREYRAGRQAGFADGRHLADVEQFGQAQERARAAEVRAGVADLCEPAPSNPSTESKGRKR